MTDSPMQLALREMRRQLTHPVGLSVVLGVAAILAILGPFGTLDRLGVVQRLAYWLVMVVGTYGVGVCAGGLFGPVILPRTPAWAGTLALGIITGLAITPVVLLVNWVAFSYLPTGWALAELIGPILLISVIVTAVIGSVERHLPGRNGEQSAAPKGPALLDRVPLEKRGPLVALSVEDHYVRIRTTKGEEMVLMRLGDAIRETAPTAGLQVHRSHWVALGQVSAARREGDRAILSMSSGADIPASRSNISALRAAGVLPK